MPASIEQQLNTYIQQLNSAQKKSLLGFIKTLFKKEGGEISIEAYNKELEEAEAEIERGEYYTNEEVMAMLKKKINDRKKDQVV
jgi:predicted transcriptional regulator